MAKLNALDMVALLLVVVGAINWGLVGILGGEWDLVARFLGGVHAMPARIVYGLIGAAGLYVAAISMQLHKA